MANEEQTSQSESELVDRAWHVAENTRTATLVTVEANKPFARPMSATTQRDEGTISFLIAADSYNTRNDGDWASVFFIDGNSYVSMTGTATISNDRARIKELWSPVAKAWWDSPDDPNIRVFEVHVSEGEIWDGPNRLFAGALLLSAAITGVQPKVGDHAKLTL